MAELQGQLENQRNHYYLHNQSTNSTPPEDPGPIQLTLWPLSYRSPIASYCANQTGRRTPPIPPPPDSNSDGGK